MVDRDIAGTPDEAFAEPGEKTVIGNGQVVPSKLAGGLGGGLLAVLYLHGEAGDAWLWLVASYVAGPAGVG